jgi:putative Mn2+ efflux pump MntP
MDAFAVSVTNGLCVRKGRVRGALMCGIIFGLFQGIMPAIGYALGMNFAEYIERFDHWIALILLGFIVASPCSLLEQIDRLRIVEMLLLAASELVASS